MTDTITFEREALYAEVWTDPVSTVSKRYGLSDNGLRKICKKLGVPLPPLGYWAKVRAGQRVKQLPLPTHSGPTTCEAWPEAHTWRFAEPEETLDILKAIDAEEALPDNQVRLTTDGEWRHKLVRALAKKLDAVDAQIAEEAKPRKQDRWEPQWDRITWRVTKPGGLIDVGGDFLCVVVTPATRQRALSIADGFLMAVEARGFKVKLEDGKTVISSKDVAVHFRMSEMAEKVREGYTSDTWDALGRLRIILRSATYGSHVPSEIKGRDEANTRLEDHLSGMLARLRRAVVGYEDREEQCKAAAIKAEKARIDRENAERERYLEEQRQLVERKKKERLVRDASTWSTAQQILQYVRAVEELVSVEARAPEGFQEWRTWALDVMQQMVDESTAFLRQPNRPYYL